jgi:hypothetical protein
MKKFFIVMAVAVLSMIPAFGQGTSDDYKKYEFFAGYSNGQVDKGIDSGNNINSLFTDRSNYNGFNVSFVRNVHRYVGLKGDFSGVYNGRELSTVVVAGTTPVPVRVKTNSSLYNFLGGVQVKDNASDARLKPFGYALVGAGHRRTKVRDFTCPTGADCTILGRNSETGIAGAFGGGLDVKLTNKFDLRVIKADYNPIRYEASTQHNLRFGFGVVFK